MTSTNFTIDPSNETCWKPIPGFAGYEISDVGRVRTRRGQIVKVRQDQRGYLLVRLYQSRQYCRFIHRLVLLAFVGPPPSSNHQTNHLNGIKHDNRPTNLEWTTARANTAHAIASRLRPRAPARHPDAGWQFGEKNRLARLTAADIPVIRELLHEQLPPGRIAERFGVTRGTIRAIKDGRTWTHVP